MKKSICFVHNVAVIGGAERMTQAIIKGLPKDEYRSTIVCPEQGKMLEEGANLNANTLTFPFYQPDLSSPVKSIRGYFNWHNLFIKEQFDAVHTGDLICTRALLTAANKTKTPVVCHIHFPFKRNFAEWVFSATRQPQAFIFCSKELQLDVGPMLAELCPNAAQHVIHNGVDVNLFCPADSQSDAIDIGIIANLQERKGHKEFLEMAKALSTQFDNLNFHIIGGDILEQPREPLLKEMATSLGIGDKVTFHGQVSNVLKLLQNLDIVVCASHQEAFPVSILEAMACGKPVVSTNVNGIPEAIIEHETGFMVPPKDATALAAAIAKLIKNEPLRQEFAKASRERVVKNFSEQKYIDKVINVYDSARK